MIVVFRAEKMIERVKREGRGDLLDKETLDFIKSIDGKRGNSYNWQSVVRGENVVWIEDAKTYVALCDCE